MPGPPPGAAAFAAVLAELLLPRDMEPEDDAEEDGDVEDGDVEDGDGMRELEDGELFEVELPAVALLEAPLLLELLPPDFDLSTPPW